MPDTKNKTKNKPNWLIRLACLYIGTGQLIPFQALLCTINYWCLTFSDDPETTELEIARYKSVRTLNFYQKFWTSFLGLVATPLGSRFFL